MVDMVFNGPANFSMDLFVVNDETGQEAKVDIGLGVFEYPTKEKVKARIQKFVDEELEAALPGFRLMTKTEAWEAVMFEQTGQRFAMAGGKEWDEI